jgi:chloramphenicol 3-O phosphotransferase
MFPSMTDVIVLNGGSSSGKSSIVTCLQRILPDQWLALGVDTFLTALPVRMGGDAAGIVFHGDGTVTTGGEFVALEDAWMVGVAAMARAGAPVIIDDVFLSGPGTQGRWRAALDGLDVLWVGVRCDPAVAEAREAARGDRTVGMARLQADAVHRGVAYDVEVDTSTRSADEAAATIAAAVSLRHDKTGRT